jgi:hypothetical protein
VGIDSALSVLAAKIFAADRLAIKSRNKHLYSYRHVYYAPHRELAFVGQSIGKIVAGTTMRTRAAMERRAIDAIFAA